ncbi:hypothetical protein F2Q70_00023035, partial [Brassica cretica]
MASSSSFLPSSSSLVRQNHFQKTSSLKATSLAKRQVTVFKKARELSILCGIEVCVIYYGSDGELKTWPKDREKVKDMARRYSQLSDMKRRKGETKLQHRLRGAVESQRQRNMYYTTMAGQEQMNHLQQHSDQVSMDQYNHGTRTLPQLPVSTSAFNQSQ